MRADAKKNYDHLLNVARTVFMEQGSDASLRDIARRAEVGLGTLYRHFPTREALLEALLRSSFEALTERADELQAADDSAAALMEWLQEIIAFTHEHRGVIAPMVSAIEDHESALHASCVSLRAAGAAHVWFARACCRHRRSLEMKDAAVVSVHEPCIEHAMRLSR